jgi:hypothetical protein
MGESPSELARQAPGRASTATEPRTRRREARVPEGRGERIARLGGMLAGIAGETALEALPGPMPSA